MRYRPVLPYAALLVPVLVLFGGSLFAPGPWVASSPQYDVPSYYAPVREFGFGEVRGGHVPLWDPYRFSGTPFVAGFQSALYYPLNLHYLVLPLARSLNIEIALHCYLLGAFMYAWARGRGLSITASLFAALAVQCSGPFYLNVFAGHLSYIAALAWAPLAFLAVDKAVYNGRQAWAIVGAVALTMSILAGHPQAVFCTLVVLVPYSLIGVVQSRRRAQSLGHLALLLVSPLFLSAAQLWPAVALSGEGVRAGGLHYVLASSLSFPPENLLTFFAPSFLGDTVAAPYTGRWMFWETCAFMGIGAFSLAGYALLAGHRRERSVWLGLALLATFLALGRYAPLYRLMYAAVPGVDSFRCPSRHFFHATLFLALLAGLGLDTLLQRPARTRWMAAGMAVVGAALAVFASALYATNADGPSPVWTRALAALQAPGEAHWRIEDIGAGAACARAAAAFGTAGATCGLLAVLYLFAGKRRAAAYGVLLIGAIELAAFAWHYRASADISKREKPALARELSAAQPDARIFDTAVANRSVELRRSDIWGYDSTALLRYAQLMAYTQGTRAEFELTEFAFQWFHPVYAMLRCQYIVDSRKDAGAVVQAFADPFPRALLVTDYSVVADFEERLAQVSDTSFNPRQRVILEIEPDPIPAPGGAQGTAVVRDESTDALLIDVETSGNALLLITDPFAADWRTRPAGPSPQSHYDILPANHVLRAIPLVAGRHHIRMEYAPPAAVWGVAASVVSSALLAAAAAWRLARRPARS